MKVKFRTKMCDGRVIYLFGHRILEWGKCGEYFRIFNKTIIPYKKCQKKRVLWRIREIIENKFSAIFNIGAKNDLRGGGLLNAESGLKPNANLESNMSANLESNMQKQHRDIFFLKINLFNRFNKGAIDFWLKVADYYNAKIVIICDKKNIEYAILREIELPNIDVIFIKSIKNKLSKKIIQIACEPYWFNAGFAHLSTFYYAFFKSNAEYFWNIDCDDTLFYAVPKMIAEKLLEAKIYAKKHSIDVFSLDMHFSRMCGVWSFGVTLAKNKNYFDLLLDYNHTWRMDSFILKSKTTINLDAYFTFLKQKNRLNVGSFGFRNIYFMHFYDAFGFPNIFLWDENHVKNPLMKDLEPKHRAHYKIHSINKEVVIL